MIVPDNVTSDAVLHGAGLVVAARRNLTWARREAAAAQANLVRLEEVHAEAERSLLTLLGRPPAAKVTPQNTQEITHG